MTVAGTFLLVVSVGFPATYFTPRTSAHGTQQTMERVILPLIVRPLMRLLLPVEIAVIEICLAGQLDILSGGDWNRWRVYIGTDGGFVIGTGGGFAVEYAVFYVRPIWAQSWR